MRLNAKQAILTAYLVALLAYWVFLAKSGLRTDFWNYFYSFSFSLLPLVGGLTGMLSAGQWGFLRSAIGRAVFFISAGLLSWGGGSMIWSYYNFFSNEPAPYPSLADIGFLLALPLWAIGMVSLSKGSGARFALRSAVGKIFAATGSVAILALSYYLLISVARRGAVFTDTSDILKAFLDVTYPTGDVVILLLALGIFGLSFQYLGGAYKPSMLALLGGFAVMYLADFIFSYTTTKETFYNGNFGDLVFTSALFLITFGVLGFATPSETDSQKEEG